MATPEFWNITIVKYKGGYIPQLNIGKEHIIISEEVSNISEAEIVKQVFEESLSNIIYYELQQFEIFRNINWESDDGIVENMIEKYLKK